MNKRWILSLVFFSMICCVLPAQEKGKVGLNIGFPTYGMTWNLTERFALRPEITFSRSTANSRALAVPPSVAPSPLESKSYSISGGISGLLYMHKWEDLSVYVSPRYLYSWSKSQSNQTTGTILSDAKSPFHSISGALGAQYTLNKRFGLFGEAGLGYGWGHSSSNSSSASFSVRSESHSLSPRGSVGLILYLK